ncbi:hypothetical protein ANN_27017 [Periplaneta americana]|uniref:Uncharacterized protein n=1 Tax=Periplaneta americana TaxID=6978 RepID=A0ABQ8RWV9_PERAM|nr:hypothetical protein ANN_27017 [Periplaneta americana]
MVQTDTGTCNDGATCLRMVDDETVGSVRACRRIRRSSLLVISRGRPEPTRLTFITSQDVFSVIQRMWFMHTLTPPHFTVIVHQYLDNQFPNGCIGRRGSIA